MHIDRRRPAASAGVTALLLVSALAVQPAPARADRDGADTLLARVSAQESEIATHRRDENVHALLQDIWETVALFHEAGNSDSGIRLQARLVRDIGVLTRMRNDQVKEGALEALGEIAHKAGSKYVRPFLKPVPAKEESPLAFAAIEAAGAIGESTLIRPLRKIVAYSKNHQAAAEAVEALGRFGHLCRERERILVALVDTLRSAMPPEVAATQRDDIATTQDPNAEPEAPDPRWLALESVLPEALNELTGQDVDTVDEWLALIAATGGNWKDLFLEPCS